MIHFGWNFLLVGVFRYGLRQQNILKKLREKSEIIFFKYF